MKKIIICCNAYPPKFIGGAELIAHDHAKALKRLGMDVVIFAGDAQDRGKRHSIRKEIYDGLTVHRVALTWEDFDPSGINFSHSRIEESFKDVLDDFLPDIVHFHNIIGLSVGLMSIAKARGIKTVLTLHDYWGFCHKNTILKNETDICRDYSRCAECLPYLSGEDHNSIPMIMRKNFFELQFKNVDVFISPSQYLANEYIKAGFPREKFKVIWNGIDVERFANITKRNSEAVVRFTYIGYLGTHKGIHVLLEALSSIGRDQPFIVNIVGDGELSAKYRKQVKSIGLDGSVKFWGRIDNIQRAYSETDVLILPSIWPENQPVTITEAMASRIPVIASNIGGNPELVEDGKTGFLFEPGNSKDLANKMQRFINDKYKITSFGENAYNKIKKYTFDNQVSLISKIYDEEYKMVEQMGDEKIIACVGHHVNPQCIQAIRSFCYKNKLLEVKILMIDWLQEDQYPLVKILWAIDADVDLNEAIIGLRNRIPLLVPENNANLKSACIKGNCGLYYKNALEAEACIRYLIENEIARVALGRCGFDFYSETHREMQ